MPEVIAVVAFLACCSLHAWESKDSSLITNELVYSPPSAPHASPWPGLVGRTSASMTLVAGPPVPTSEVAFRALRAAPSAPIGTAVHRRDTGDAAASHTGGLCTWHCTGSRQAVPADGFCALSART